MEQECTDIHEVESRVVYKHMAEDKMTEKDFCFLECMCQQREMVIHTTNKSYEK